MRKYIYAFADGQLDVKGNCDILDHLKMCRACGRLVDDHQALRAKLARDLERVPVPASLRKQILTASVFESGSSSGDTSAPMTSRQHSVLRPMAVAACVLLAAGAVWYLPNVVHSSSTISVPRSASAATMIAQTHQTCCSHGAAHQNEKLPRELASLGSALSRHYRDTIAPMTPDLSRFGFAFESANLCGVRNKAGCEGAHIVYASKGDSQRLSVFSIPRWDCLDKCGKGGIQAGDGYRRYEVDDETGQSLHIIAWHQNATTYICCGAVPFEEMMNMVSHTRSAWAESDAAIRLALIHHRD